MLKAGSASPLKVHGDKNKRSCKSLNIWQYFSRKEENDDAIKIMPVRELPRENSWQATALLILMDDLGTGLLTIPYAFSRVGIIPGFVITILSGVASWWTAILLCHVIIEFPDAFTMGALAEKLCGYYTTQFVHATIYGSIFLFITYYLLICAKAFQDITWMCVYSAAIWCALFTFPFAQLRTLGSIVSKLGVLSFLMVNLTVLICLVGAEGYSPYESTRIFSMDNLRDFLEATTAILLSYSGKNIYTEIIYEMENPRDSPKAMHLAYTVMILLYSAIGYIGYSIAGEYVPAYFLDAISSSSLREAASFVLLMHVLFIIVLNIQIVARATHSKVDSSSVDALHVSDDKYWRAVVVYLLITLFFFILAFIVMNTIPYFTDLIELISALLVTLTNFMIPMYLYWLLGKRRPDCTYVMCIAWFLVGIFALVVTIFGTYDALDDWLQNSAYIWTCNP